MLINKLVQKLQSQTPLQTYQALKLLATEIPLPLNLQQENLIDAAVLIPVIIYEQSASILLTVRSQQLYHHAGQISFPGGKLDLNEEPLTGVLRETEEEIGLKANQINIIAPLGKWPSYSGYLIQPFLGLIPAPIVSMPCKHEVDEIFELPLNIAFNTERYHRTQVTSPQPRQFYELIFDNKRIWGFTAAILLLLANYSRRIEMK